MAYYGDHAPQLAGSVVTLATIAVITFALRIYTRVRNGSFGIDDWSMTGAMVSSMRILSKQDAKSSATFYSIDCRLYRWRIQWRRCSSVQTRQRAGEDRHAGEKSRRRC